MGARQEWRQEEPWDSALFRSYLLIMLKIDGRPANDLSHKMICNEE
jgi:hypothetical protein